MDSLLEFLTFIRPYGSHSYFVLLGLLVACGFGLPMPEDIILITGGILASQGVVDFWGIVAVCLLGVLVGDGTVFMIGRHMGPRLKSNPLFNKILSDKRDQKVQGVIHKYGDKVIFIARFMPGLRTPIFLTCGTYQILPWKFLVLDGAAALISVPLWVYVGYLFGANLQELQKFISQFRVAFYLLIGVVILLFVGAHMIKRRALKNIATE